MSSRVRYPCSVCGSHCVTECIQCNACGVQTHSECLQMDWDTRSYALSGETWNEIFLSSMCHYTCGWRAWKNSWKVCQNMSVSQMSCRPKCLRNVLSPNMLPKCLSPKRLVAQMTIDCGRNIIIKYIYIVQDRTMPRMHWVNSYALKSIVSRLVNS